MFGESGNCGVLCVISELFCVDGGLCLFDGNFGCGVIKVFLVFDDCMVIEVLVIVFND